MEILRGLFDKNYFPIFLFGAVGRGKSYLAALMFARWTGRVVMSSYSDFIANAFRASKNGEISYYNATGQLCSFTETGWWENLRTVGLVIIDDIGVGSPHEMRSEFMLKLLEVRKNRPLVFTGNLTPKELLEHFDSRVQSRIIAGAPVEMGGDDLRLDGVRTRAVQIRNTGAKP